MTPVDREQAAAELQHGTVVNIAGAGHNIRRDQFARYLAYVQPFLEQFLWRPWPVPVTGYLRPIRAWLPGVDSLASLAPPYRRTTTNATSQDVRPSTSWGRACQPMTPVAKVHTDMLIALYSIHNHRLEVLLYSQVWITDAPSR
jgi:hypothetical protein